MTEKQREFRENLVRYLRTIRREASLEELVPIYCLTYVPRKPNKAAWHLSALLERFESEGLVACNWLVHRETDLVKSVRIIDAKSPQVRLPKEVSHGA